MAAPPAASSANPRYILIDSTSGAVVDPPRHFQQSQSAAAALPGAGAVGGTSSSPSLHAVLVQQQRQQQRRQQQQQLIGSAGAGTPASVVVAAADSSSVAVPPHSHQHYYQYLVTNEQPSASPPAAALQAEFMRGSGGLGSAQGQPMIADQASAASRWQAERLVGGVLRTPAATTGPVAQYQQQQLQLHSAQSSVTATQLQPLPRPDATVRPDIRIRTGVAGQRYGRVLCHDDVVIVPNLFGSETDFGNYDRLMKEVTDMDNLSADTSTGASKAAARTAPSPAASGKVSGGGDSSLPSSALMMVTSPEKSRIIQSILDVLCTYFDIEKESVSYSAGLRMDPSLWRYVHVTKQRIY